ncbi:leucine-rich repeat-containing protein 63 [Sigmodon hispidus]
MSNSGQLPKNVALLENASPDSRHLCHVMKKRSLMKRSDCHSLKTQQYPQLLRRPLPPKLPKLPLCKKKFHTEIPCWNMSELNVGFCQNLATNVDMFLHVENRKFFTQITSNETEQSHIKPVSIQSICLDHDHKAREKVVSILPHSRGTRPDVHWKIPHSAAGSMFIPSCLSASSRVYRRKLRQMKRARKSKKKKGKKETFFKDKPTSNILILTNQFAKPYPASYSRLITSKFKPVSADSRPAPKSPDYTQELPLLRDVTETLFSPIPSTSSTVPEPRWSERPQRHIATLNTVVLNIATFPAAQALPLPTLPRRPPRQVAIENAIESGRIEGPKPPDALIRTIRKKIDPDAHVLRGEGFKTIAATRYETIMAMSTLAIINCQVYGRNALSLKGFFLVCCPDLTPLAFQLVYLNLSFNDLSHFPTEVFCLKNLQVLKLRNNPIKEIPSEIQQLKYLRIFCIAFNFIRELPFGLFYLHYLEDLDVSYNELYNIPNDIQRLRCIYLDHKRQSDPNFKNRLREGRKKQKLAKERVGLSKLPDLKDAEAIQKFFLEEIQLGEELLAQGEYEKGVEHLTNTIAVWAASAAAASVTADSSATSVPDASDQASNH